MPGTSTAVPPSGRSIRLIHVAGLHVQFPGAFFISQAGSGRHTLGAEHDAHLGPCAVGGGGAVRPPQASSIRKIARGNARLLGPDLEPLTRQASITSSVPTSVATEHAGPPDDPDLRNGRLVDLNQAASTPSDIVCKCV